MPGRKPGPSVKDDETYEALRDEGASKEKAARIANASANTSRSAVGRRAARPAATRTGQGPAREACAGDRHRGPLLDVQGGARSTPCATTDAVAPHAAPSSERASVRSSTSVR